MTNAVADTLNVQIVRVRFHENYMPHLSARMVDMYVGPARHLVEAGVADIVEEPEQPRKTGKARHGHSR